MKDEIGLLDINLDDLVDVAILSHGFMPYKRDYYFHIETMWKDELAGQYIIIFKHCYSLVYETIADKNLLNQSWDDCFIDYNEYLNNGEPEGYVWGTNWANSYPGFSTFNDSEKALEWSNKLKKQMKELIVESEIYKINLIYNSWTIKKLNNQTELINKAFISLR